MKTGRHQFLYVFCNIVDNKYYSSVCSTRLLSPDFPGDFYAFFWLKSELIAGHATTGSNSFRATQSITGSLTVTGQIIAQTLNVQQVTSSIIYSSGSNNFGCDLNSRQTFTGSVNITGSQTVFGNLGIGTGFTINSKGTT